MHFEERSAYKDQFHKFRTKKFTTNVTEHTDKLNKVN